ncbi:hypothetical protein CC86DRAFT_447220 [Ophiobolus disseminans]|uniref:Uncharacterized protein n=1 Tax=Ophiobolus disseminans TaxID=1469910 RepID=A0A6A6ZTF8_9PLEO|nr:hypothetical protein CC86DRAFT_447220 [Ophiobolus disseminans]
MGWWRRDPFSRTPVQLSARILRDRESALRTRCFSRTPPKSAQHEDDGGKKRPSNMTTLEWMQLQHYERWRKRLLEDPYKTLFGASNDMLSGKGLKDWEWVHKSFPKWMLQEMNMDEKPKEAPEDKPVQPGYPKKVEIRHGHGIGRGQFRAADGGWAPRIPFESMKRKPDPLHHAFMMRDENSGVASPSDPRRPREDSSVKVVGTVSNEASSKDPASTLHSSGQSTVPVAPLAEPLASSNITAKQASQHDDGTRAAISAAREEAIARESSFIDEFLNTRSEHQAENAGRASSKDWRQTALQRRATSESKDKPNVQSSLLENENVYIPSTPQMAEVASEKQSVEPRNKNVDWLLQQETPRLPKDVNPQSNSTSPRSASRVLSQLPEHDIDFLSAADIRASMGAKRSRLPSDDQRQVERRNLEKAFAAANEIPVVDSMREAQVVNDQYVRRAARQLMEPHTAPEASTTHPAARTSTIETPVESSIERMRKWLETTGASFAKSFWQDPTEHADLTRSKLFFDKAAHYLKKGQAVTRQITEDLEKDIPASTALLKRFKSDEEALDLAIHRLRQRSFSGKPQGLSPRKMKTIESVKTRFLQTNNELEKAYETLQELAGTNTVADATGSFKRRLTAASKVLHKNAQLLRMLIWSLQTRLEDPKIDRNILTNYKVVADNLLSLRDTQMTLMRLVDRAMSIYGVVPHTAVDNNSSADLATQLGADTCEEPFVRARLAADAHLINEIRAHKSTSPELPDAGPSQAPKPTVSKALDDASPLAHSLFRPFGPAFAKLGSPNSAEEVQRKLGDMKLVDEVKKAYDETSRGVTVDHGQTASDPEEIFTMEEGNKVKKFEMLKDDPAAIEFDSSQEMIPPTSGSRLERPGGTGALMTKDAASNEPVPLASGVEAPPFNNTAPPESATLPKQQPEPSFANLSTNYTILVRDPQTDTLSITTSSTGPPRDTSPSLPLHQALSALSSPAKFIPYITSGLEVVSASKDILVLRDALDSSASTRGFATVGVPHNQGYVHDRNVNPIDGTARLSPTGYVGPEESAEQLEKEFEERRRLAGKVMDKEAAPGLEEAIKQQRKQGRKKARAGVVKTAIWVAGVCYVVGVAGEVFGGA